MNCNEKYSQKVLLRMGKFVAQTCSADLKRLISEKVVAFCWLFISFYWWCTVTQTATINVLCNKNILLNNRRIVVLTVFYWILIIINTKRIAFIYSSNKNKSYLILLPSHCFSTTFATTDAFIIYSEDLLYSLLTKVSILFYQRSCCRSFQVAVVYKLVAAKNFAYELGTGDRTGNRWQFLDE